jgi:peptidoglycan/LPS O-acetylase OafA/YrhL
LISHLLDEGFSLFLDLTRFLAAIAFVAVHATIPQMEGGWFKIGAIGVDAPDL